jgi:transcriptional regulator with XRE-family HTH domain
MDSKPIYAHIGALIKTRRKHFKLTQETLATQLAISRASLANIETGRQKILVHQLYSLAAALDLSPADFLPAPSAVAPATVAASIDLPLPAGLKPQHKEQIARIFANPSPASQKPRGEDHAKQKR